MELLSERIAYSKGEDDLTVYIKASSLKDAGKLRLMKIWVILWSVSGMLILSQLFFDYAREEKLFIVIYLAFWAYFEFRIVYAYYFRKYGVELVYVNNSKFMLRRDILTRKGKPEHYSSASKNPFRAAIEKSSFNKAYFSSFWVTSGGSVAFGVRPKEYRFGNHLEEAETEKLVKLLNHHFKPSATHPSK